METKQEILQNCTVEGTTVKLPSVQLDRKLYLEVAKALELIGGKWKGGKISGFVFPMDPTELLSQIAGGEQRNLKKEFQFFATPQRLAQKMVYLLEIEDNSQLILEPSGGQGAIINEVLRQHPGTIVHTYELMDINRTFLSKIKDCVILGEDFLTSSKPTNFDRIIANPPFAKNQDIDHIKEMYRVLKPGGRLVTISSRHWLECDNRKETEFKNWLLTLQPDIENIPAGEFKESGTLIGTLLITINKPL